MGEVLKVGLNQPIPKNTKVILKTLFVEAVGKDGFVTTAT